MIERFSLEQFRAALPGSAIHLGIISGEHCFEIPLLGGKAKFYIRSSIDGTGIARDVADDSIRILLLDGDDSFIISKYAKVRDYVTRQPGWSDRLKKELDRLAGILVQVKECKTCGTLLRVNRVHKKESRVFGKLFLSCEDREHKNDWAMVNEDTSVDYLSLIKDSNSAPLELPKQVYKSMPISGNVNFDILNDDQSKIVKMMGKGAVVVDAGAGSGKTRTIENMIAYMLLNGYDPSRLLAVTFSVKAASEMRVRIAKAIWPDISEEELAFFADPRSGDPDGNFNREWVEADPIRKFLIDWVCTIHAMSLRLLKANGMEVTALKGKHELSVKEILRDGLDELGWKESLKTVEWYIDRAVNEGISWNIKKDSSEFFRKEISERNGGYYPSDCPYEAPDWIAELYKRYVTYCVKNKVLSFAMMQANLCHILRKDPFFARKISEMFDCIVVDEAQDTDFIQSEIIFTLADKCENVFFIGDVWQSLYRFRGAVPEIMEEKFMERWGNKAIRLTMPINYRSDQVIVEQSTKFIFNNYIGREQFFKRAVARPDAPRGKEIEYSGYYHFDEMCEGMIETIANDPDKSFGDWYILSRTRAECAYIHTQFIRAKIPCVNLSGGLLLGAPHVRKVIAYARLACDYQGARNNTDILTEVANVASDKFVSPSTRRRHLEGCTNAKPWIDCGCPIVAEEGISKSAVRYYGSKSVEAVGGRWSGILEQMNETNKGGYPSQASKGATDLVNFVLEIEKLKDDAGKCISYIIEHSVFPWLLHEEGIDVDDLGEDSKAEDFDVLVGMIEPYMSVEQFLIAMDELMQGASGNGKDAVAVSTVHKVKGLQRKKVIVNMTRMPILPPRRMEGLLPVGIPNSIADERNIAYVACTRAEKELYIFTADEWNGMELPLSEFVGQLGFVFEEEDEETELEEY